MKHHFLRLAAEPSGVAVARALPRADSGERIPNSEARQR
jgi:hypothetical protein